MTDRRGRAARRRPPGEPREFLRIRVADEGEGIPPELIERVTEPFFTTKSAGKGTGLGLSMVAGFVQQSGGVFRIESECRPRHRRSRWSCPRPAPSRPTRPRPTPSTPSDIGIGSVLVVDDDESVRLILSEQLRDLGLEVDRRRGRRGTRCDCSSKAPDKPEFVLTDFSMPRLDGMGLLEAVREQVAAHQGRDHDRQSAGKPGATATRRRGDPASRSTRTN